MLLTNPPKEALRDSIIPENLLKHSKALESIAYSTPGRNRVTGSLGHNLTVEYLTSQLAALGDYYDIEVQPWQGEVQQSGEISFTVNAVEYEVQVVEFSPNGSVTNAPLIPVPNLGCDAVSLHGLIDSLRTSDQSRLTVVQRPTILRT